jgi:hypothetical protein
MRRKDGRGQNIMSMRNDHRWSEKQWKVKEGHGTRDESWQCYVITVTGDTHHQMSLAAEYACHLSPLSLMTRGEHDSDMHEE